MSDSGGKCPKGEGFFKKHRWEWAKHARRCVNCGRCEVSNGMDMQPVHKTVYDKALADEAKEEKQRKEMIDSWKGT